MTGGAGRAAAPGQPTAYLLHQLIHVLAGAIEEDWEDRTGHTARRARYAQLRDAGMTMAQAARELRVDPLTASRYEARQLMMKATR